MPDETVVIGEDVPIEVQATTSEADPPPWVSELQASHDHANILLVVLIAMVLAFGFIWSLLGWTHGR